MDQIILNFWLVRETEKAYLFETIDCIDEYWIAKSLINSYFEEEDKSISIEVLEWVAIKNQWV